MCSHCRQDTTGRGEGQAFRRRLSRFRPRLGITPFLAPREKPQGVSSEHTTRLQYTIGSKPSSRIQRRIRAPPPAPGSRRRCRCSFGLLLDRVAGCRIEAIGVGGILGGLLAGVLLRVAMLVPVLEKQIDDVFGQHPGLSWGEGHIASSRLMSIFWNPSNVQSISMVQRWGTPRMRTVHRTALVWASQERASAWSEKVIIGASSASTSQGTGPSPNRTASRQGSPRLWHPVCRRATRTRDGSCLPPGWLMPGEVDLDFLVQVLELLDGRVPDYRAEEDPRVGLRIAINRRAVVDADLDFPAIARMQVDMDSRSVIVHGSAPSSVEGRSARTP